MSDADLWVCPECSTVQATTNAGAVPLGCEACGFEDDLEGPSRFTPIGGVSR